MSCDFVPSPCCDWFLTTTWPQYYSLIGWPWTAAKKYSFSSYFAIIWWFFKKEAWHTSASLRDWWPEVTWLEKDPADWRGLGMLWRGAQLAKSQSDHLGSHGPSWKVTPPTWTLPTTPTGSRPPPRFQLAFTCQVKQLNQRPENFSRPPIRIGFHRSVSP